jgi:hypothetical protein
MRLIWGKREADYFRAGGWTGQIRLIWLKKLVSKRSGDREVWPRMSPRSSVLRLLHDGKLYAYCLLPDREEEIPWN